jgi:hypothetical protein
MFFYVIQKRCKANKAYHHIQYNGMNAAIVLLGSIEINLSRMFLQLILEFYLCTPKKKIAQVKLSFIYQYQASDLINWSVRLGVRTLGFHLSNRGSIPLRTTKKSSASAGLFLCC